MMQIVSTLLVTSYQTVKHGRASERGTQNCCCANFTWTETNMATTFCSWDFV